MWRIYGVRGGQTQFVCGQGAYLYSSKGEDAFEVRASLHGIRRENEEVGLSIFIQGVG